MTEPVEDKEFYRYGPDHRFARMYPLLTRQIVEAFDIRGGTCLDIGTGGAPMLIELAKLTDCSMIGLDAVAEILDMAKENVVNNGLPLERFRFVEADVAAMPFEDNSIGLVISRGSIPFWPDHVAAFREIYRVMEPGGVGFIGCGFSRYQPIEEVRAMRPKWSAEGEKDTRNDWKQPGFLPDVLKKAGVEGGTVHADDYGVWVEIHKPA